MADYDGDSALRPDECKANCVSRCENMKEVGGGMECERYACGVCGAYYTLWYEDMA
jgi:hypothetical protein